MKRVALVAALILAGFLMSQFIMSKFPANEEYAYFAWEITPNASTYVPAAEVNFYPSGEAGNVGFDFMVMRGSQPGGNKSYGWKYFEQFTETEHTDNNQWYIKVDIVEQVSGIQTVTFDNGSNLGEWVDLWDDWQLYLWTVDKIGIPNDVIVDISIAPDNGGSMPDTANAVVRRMRFLSYRMQYDYTWNDEFSRSGTLDGDDPSNDWRNGSLGPWVDLWWAISDYDHGYFSCDGNSADSVAGETSTPDGLVAIDSGEADNFRLSTEVDFGSNSAGAGIAFRVQDVLNYWLLAVKNPGDTNPVLGLYQVVSGTHTLKDSVTCTGLGPFAQFDFYYLRVTVVNDAIEGEIGFTDSTVNDRVTHPYLVNATDVDFTTETMVGLWADDGGAAFRRIIQFPYPVGIDPVIMPETGITASYTDNGTVTADAYIYGSSNDPNSPHSSGAAYNQDTPQYFDVIDFAVAGGSFSTGQYVAKVSAVSGDTSNVTILEYGTTSSSWDTWIDARNLRIYLESDIEGALSAVVDLTIGVDDGAGGSLHASYEKTKRITLNATSTGT